MTMEPGEGKDRVSLASWAGILRGETKDVAWGAEDMRTRVGDK